MKVNHSIDPALLKGSVKVVVIGAGGTGSALLPRLMQLHYALVQLGHPAGLHVEVFDPDTVSVSNIGRQGFFPCDVGLNKAVLLVNRLNMAWGTSWQGHPVLFDHNYKCSEDADIYIGCVDSRKSRKEILKYDNDVSAYYIDSGNSVNSGQVVIGQIGRADRSQSIRLPHVGDLFPEMVDESLDASDEEPSCSVADSLRKQSLVINTAMATEIFNLLWTLFRTGKLNYSGRFVNLESGISTPIKLDTEVWARMGYVVSDTK